MVPIGCPETSVRNYRYSLRNSPEERSSQLLPGGSLKSHKNFHCLQVVNMLHIAVFDGDMITRCFTIILRVCYIIIKYKQFKLRTRLHASACLKEPGDFTYFNFSLAFDKRSHQILKKVERIEFRQNILLDFIVMHYLDVLLYARYRFISPLLTFVLRNNALKLLFGEEE